MNEVSGQSIGPIFKGVKIGPIDCPETSVSNYQTAVCNIPEERGRSLKSCLRELTETTKKSIYEILMYQKPTSIISGSRLRTTVRKMTVRHDQGNAVALCSNITVSCPEFGAVGESPP